MPERLNRSAILRPNLGLYFDQADLSVPLRALKDGLNFRIKEGQLTNVNLGWSDFGTFAALNASVVLIDNFFLRSGAQTLIFGSLNDLYKYNVGPDTTSFITPIEATGTVDVSAANPAVVTSASGPTVFSTNGVKAGDEIHFGSAVQNDPLATWYIIDTVDSDTQVTLTTTVTGAPLTGQAYTIRKLFTGDLQDPFSTATFVNDAASGDDQWFATNGVDNMVHWNATDTFVTELDTIGFIARQLAVFDNMMIYADITTDAGVFKPTTVINSDVGDPDDVLNGLASEFVVHDGTDPIVNMLELGDNLAIYSGRNVTIAQFVGAPLIYTFRTGFVGLGPLAARLVSDFGDFHEFVGSDTKYTFDGVTVEESGSHAWREILRTRDPDRSPMAFAHFDEENGDLIWVLPLNSDPGAGANPGTNPMATAYPEHYLEDVGNAPTPVSKRDFPFSASGFFERQTTLTWDAVVGTWADNNFRWNDIFFQAAFPFNLVGDTSGNIYTLNTSQNRDDGTALDSFVRFGRRALGDGRARGLLRRIYPFATKFLGINMMVDTHYTDHANGPTTTTQSDTFSTTLAEGGHFVSPMRRGRFVEVEFGTDGPSEPWELAGYDVDVVPGGRR